MSILKNGLINQMCRCAKELEKWAKLCPTDKSQKVYQNIQVRIRNHISIKIVVVCKLEEVLTTLRVCGYRQTANALHQKMYGLWRCRIACFEQWCEIRGIKPHIALKAVQKRARHLAKMILQAAETIENE